MILTKKKMTEYGKKFYQAEFELEIENINYQLSQKNCKNVEFLRGMLCVYKKLIDFRTGWVKENIDHWFK
jgi:hypothetical protein